MTKKVAPAAPAAMPKTATISIRLLKTGRAVSDAIRADRNVKPHPSSLGTLFWEQSGAQNPTWLPFVNAFAASEPLALTNMHCGALLFLDIRAALAVKADADGGTGDTALGAADAAAPLAAAIAEVGAVDEVRTMVISFGGGHHALNQDALERNFGLRVALNSIARDDLKNIDVATLDATTFQRRVQASRKSDLRLFGIDIQQDLLRLAGGAPTDATFARSLTGKDSLTITASLSAANVLAKCTEALRLYGAKHYETDYKFIDHIVPVTDRDIVDALDGILFGEIKGLLDGKPSDLHLTISEIIDPEAAFEIGYYGAGFKSGTKTGYGELAIEDYIAELKDSKPSEIQDIAAIKTTHEIQLVKDGKGSKQRALRIYDCFVLEAELKGNNHVLFAGEWYLIDKTYFAEVEKHFRSLLKPATIVEKTTAQNERELIAELDARADLLNIDQVKASPFGAAGANIEPCDFLTKDRVFLHLKDGHGSAPISHLWSQGVVAAEAFVRDDVFRKSFRKKALQRQVAANKQDFEAILPTGRQKPVPSRYTVVYGIMRHRYQRTGTLGLPFFSKVSLRAAALRIQDFGYRLEVHLIEKCGADDTTVADKGNIDA